MEKQNKKTDGKTSKAMNQEECNKSWNEEFGDEEGNELKELEKDLKLAYRRGDKFGVSEIQERIEGLK